MFYGSSAKCPMCVAEEDIVHVFSCNSEAAIECREQIVHSIGVILASNSTEFSEWWCAIINGCFIALGDRPVIDNSVTATDLEPLHSQITLSTMHFFQGRSQQKH